MEIELDIENMTMSEYLEYEAAKERRLWDDVRSRRSSTNYNEADVDSFHWNKSKAFSYPYSHNLTPPRTCSLPVQPYPKNCLVSTNESNDVDIENMTIAEYNLYVAKQGLGMNQLKMEPDIKNMTVRSTLSVKLRKNRSRRSPTNYNGADVDSFHRNKSNTFYYQYSHYLPTPPVQPYPKNYLVPTKVSNDVDMENMTIAEYNLFVAKQGLRMNLLRAENMKQMGQDIVQDSIWEQDDDSEEDQEEDNEIVQPLIPEPINTTPLDDHYVAPATKSTLDELLEEIKDEILNVTMVDDEADFNPTKDLEELERLLAKEPQSNFRIY
ncbi:hypothetical protein Tco_0343296 [Tanacetum coccineum]